MAEGAVAERSLAECGISVFIGVSRFGCRRSKRKEGKAFIPVPNEHLRGLAKVNQGMAAFMQKRNPQKTATLDQDATLVETAKRDALFSYQGFKSYQPLNTWWAEHADGVAYGVSGRERSGGL